MNFNKKLQAARNSRQLSQEKLASLIGVSRQAVAKWEAGHGYPDIENLILLSDLLKVSLDRLIKPDSEICSITINPNIYIDINNLIDFLCVAKKKTYAGKGAADVSSRPHSHDLSYKDGAFLYIDTYLGGEAFSGEEAVWMDDVPIWSLNYCGRVLSDSFSGDFLKDALLNVSHSNPFRGPAIYRDGDYSYHCSVNGDFNWFQGYEEIFCLDAKTYECHFHGGLVK